jgi:hypothetical protein
MCPHNTLYVPSYYYICVLMLFAALRSLSGSTCNRLTCNRRGFTCNRLTCNKLANGCLGGGGNTCFIFALRRLYMWSSYCSYICVLIRRGMDVAASPATDSPAAVLVEEETLAALSTNFARGARQQAHQRSPHSRSNHMFETAGGIAGGRRRGGGWRHALGGVLGSRPLGFDMSWTPCG